MSRDATYNELLRVNDASAEVELAMDEEAFRGFYDRHARSVWAYLARLSGDRQLADDLLQETFYRFLRGSSAEWDELHRRNSLYAIATNVARDAHRRRMVRLPFLTHRDPESCGGANPADSAGRAADLTRALQALKPRERAMLWLAYAEGASHDEIASAVGVQPSSLKSLLFRARRKVASLLEPKPAGVAR
jgi:RNA polymerase sigma-70 factor (ECF subfamily)